VSSDEYKKIAISIVSHTQVVPHQAAQWFSLKRMHIKIIIVIKILTFLKPTVLSALKLGALLSSYIEETLCKFLGLYYYCYYY